MSRSGSRRRVLAGLRAAASFLVTGLTWFGFFLTLAPSEFLSRTTPARSTCVEAEPGSPGPAPLSPTEEEVWLAIVGSLSHLAGS